MYIEKVPKKDIEEFIRRGDIYIDYALRNKAKRDSGDNISGVYKQRELPPSIIQRADIVNELLHEVKICDPAIGSGAFPVGLMNEIVRARYALSAYGEANPDRKIYNFKKHCIKESIYGVDIDSNAVEIAKLRLWLSLIVDEDDLDSIEPLPNLDYKIVCGNSLIGVDHEDMFVLNSLNKIEKLKEEYFETTGQKNKKELHTKIDDIIYNVTVVRNCFDFKIHFSEIFHGNSGFDIVIGNPPYGVSIKGNYRREVEFYLGKVPDYEIYYYFIELAQNILKNKGVKTFIIPNTFLFNVFAEKYRKKLLIDWDIQLIIDCTRFKIFEKAVVYNAITVFSKSNSHDYIGYKNTLIGNTFFELSKSVTEFISKKDLNLFAQNWALIFKLPKRISNIILKIKSCNDKLINTFTEISQGLIAYDKYRGQSKDVINKRAFHFKEKVKKDLKPWLYGENVTPYSVKWNGVEFIDYCKGIANPRQPKFFKGKRVLIREITNPKIYAGYTDVEQYHDPSVIVILNNNKDNILLLLAILNSKLATFYHFNSSPKATKGAFPKILVKDIKEFPLPKISQEAQQLFIDLVDIILTKKENGKDTTEEERQIDQMVYKLYDLTPEEIAIVKGSN